MNTRLSFLFLGFVATFTLSAEPLTGLTSEEEREISERLETFYASDDPEVMSRPVPRFSLAQRRFYRPPDPETWDEPTPREERERGCRQERETLFPEPLRWEAPTPRDRVTNLARTWMDGDRILSDLARLPVSGRTEMDPWSGDYWPYKNGGIAYRYAEGRYYSTYDQAAAAYSQPSQWYGALRYPWETLRGILDRWSPAEKYDLSVGDESFSLTRQQKGEGERHRNQDGEVPRWVGLCHGWAAASLMVPRPKSAVYVRGARQYPIVWYPDEVKALATLMWSNGKFPTNFIGGRCNTKSAEKYPNGRLKQEECFDSNPSTFLLALGNLVGRQKASFLMDVAFDFEVWNHAVIAYEVTYFNPLDTTRRSRNWQDVAVPYDRAFKARDRFQRPLTRGIRQADGSYDDSRIARIVGGIATVTYNSENRPTHGTTPTADTRRRMTFTFDLELYPHAGGFYSWGGEWHENAHPDFLWLPQKDAKAVSPYDAQVTRYDPMGAPDPSVVSVARQASAKGLPLCKVLSVLVRSTSGQAYQCS